MANSQVRILLARCQRRKDVALSSTAATTTTTTIKANTAAESNFKLRLKQRQPPTQAHTHTYKYSHTHILQVKSSSSRTWRACVSAASVCVCVCYADIAAAAFVRFAGTTLYQRHLTDCKHRAGGERERGRGGRQRSMLCPGSARCSVQSKMPVTRLRQFRMHVHVCTLHLCMWVCVIRSPLPLPHTPTHCLLKWHFKVRSLLAQHKFPLFHFASFLQQQQQQRQQQRLLLTCTADDVGVFVFRWFLLLYFRRFSWYLH